MICDRLPHPKLNEAEICIWRCDNTPLWAYGSIIDALKHLISPAGNSKHGMKKWHEGRLTMRTNLNTFQMKWLYWETKAEFWFMLTENPLTLTGLGKGLCEMSKYHLWGHTEQAAHTCYNITMDRSIKTLSCVKNGLIKCTFSETTLKRDVSWMWPIKTRSNLMSFTCCTAIFALYWKRQMS